MRPWTAEVVSDVVLVALPTQILWWTRLPRNEHILMLSILTMSLLSVMVSIVHVTFVIPVSGYTAGMTADIEVRWLQRLFHVGLKRVSCTTGCAGSHGLQSPRLGGRPLPFLPEWRGY